MKTVITEMFSIEMPIFAFSHCRDVVVATSKAGGMGVLGAAWMSAEQLEQELTWIDAHIDGLPYGVDMVFPQKFVDVSAGKNPSEIIAAEQRDFINELMTKDGVPPLPQADLDGWYKDYANRMNFTPKESEMLLEVALRHPIKLVVSALGVAPKSLIDLVHAHGIKFGSLVGSVQHAHKQMEAGVDVIVAQGTEAGGHSGKITSMVLWPQIVDAVMPLPVLAAGGIGRGRQMAAALALGAEGVWCGSIWLGTSESEVSPGLKQALFNASSEDAVHTLGYTSKPCRSLRSKYTEAWERPDAPEPLTMPLQSILYGEPARRAERANRADWMTYGVGQIVGDIKLETSVKHVMYDFSSEYLDTMERLRKILADE